MAHRKIGSLRSKFGISRSIDDLTHIFSDKSKSDTEAADHEAPCTNYKNVKRSMRQKYRSGRLGKSRERYDSTTSVTWNNEVEDFMPFDITVWQKVLPPASEKDELWRKGKQRYKDDKKLEKKADRSKLTISKSEGAILARKLPDQTDAKVEKKISTASCPPYDFTAEDDFTSPSIPEESMK